MESSREKNYEGSESFSWVHIMGDEISEHSITSCWVCFAGKMPARTTLYRILWVQEDERRARIVNPTEKNYGYSKD
jgi:hypothetical protein